MVTLTGEQVQKNSGLLRAEARRAPVQITYHGRPELVVLSTEDYEILRANRKLAMHMDDLTQRKVQRIADTPMSPEHDTLNALMDE
ncbi:MAG: type II toxin-antitoxin system prevent-host-death family antitoxin [Rhodospirillaceae bacterium]|nr:type II toxin-antitoxin system prevent-host-death family antitoxin [Rhodospirillaceae bacterium]